ncbi:undecaprenyl-diphosphatase [Bacillus sp. FSL K6-3431]|uniref:undecaprenyl-diphosphatase n=1 Tax=Bacillus sp. FSL K6-3431 TaxID=2921500 RepID=UPI0030F8BCD5
MSIPDINVDLFRMINNLGKEITYLNSTMVFIAEYLVFFLALAVLIFWFTRRHENRIMIICASITFFSAVIVGKLAGKIHSNNQPFAELSNVNQLIGHAVDNSFPSDHTILFFSFCMTIFLFKRKAGLLWIGLAILVGFSRIWVGVHYPGDVIVGALISIMFAVIIYFTMKESTPIKKILALYEKGEQLILPKHYKNKSRSR